MVFLSCETSKVHKVQTSQGVPTGASVGITNIFLTGVEACSTGENALWYSKPDQMSAPSEEATTGVSSYGRGVPVNVPSVSPR